MYIIILLFQFLYSYSNNPPNEYVGAPGQSNCIACHTNDVYMNDLNASLDLVGLPEEVIGGETYRLDVVLTNLFGERWGFELASVIGPSVFQNSLTLIQAGELEPFDSLTTISEVENNITYIKQTDEGSYENQDNIAIWSVNWTAPLNYYGPISFYASGVAGNNSTGNLGDYSYTVSKSVNINFNYPNPENVDFSTEVQPIFNTYCIACHNEETQYNNNGLILTDGFGYSSYENLILGGNNGSPVIPFNAQESLLYQVIDHSIYPNDYGVYQMPYFSFQIPENYIDVIRVWIIEGALPQESCLIGDFNYDSIINVQDVIIIVNCVISENCDLNECNDLNLDQIINVLDVIQLVNIVLDN